MAFTNEQLERYSRHILLSEVGVKGQKKLLDARVLIIGAGGLGAPCALYLAAAGVGTIGVADADEVDLSNLQRQVIHSTPDVGKAKVESAKESIEAINPDVTVKTYRTFVTADNIMDLIADYDFIIDGTDNFPAKFLINDACVLAKKSFSHGFISPEGACPSFADVVCVPAAVVCSPAAVVCVPAAVASLLPEEQPAIAPPAIRTARTTAIVFFPINPFFIFSLPFPLHHLVFPTHESKFRLRSPRESPYYTYPRILLQAG